MALHIEDPETERLAQALAAKWGTSMEDAVEAALRSTLRDSPVSSIEIKRRTAPTPEDQERMRRAVDEIVRRVAAMPVLDNRTPEEIIGYDENGLPT